MISDEVRRNIVAQAEGNCLQQAGNGADEAAALARCVVDGWMNGLVRLDGREKAAEFAFALSDRIAGGIRAPTAFPAATPIAKPAPAPPMPAQPEPTWREVAAKAARAVRLKTCLTWWAAGFFAGWIVSSASR